MVFKIYYFYLKFFLLFICLYQVLAVARGSVNHPWGMRDLVLVGACTNF